MSDLRIVAALGRSSHAPLLAVHPGCGFVVLGHAGPELGPAKAFVVAPVDLVTVEERPFAVCPYIAGQDLAVLLDAHPEGLPETWAAAIAADLVEGLNGLHAGGIAHGDVRADNVRVGLDGVTHWVGVRGGDSDSDWRELSDLFERVVADPERVVKAIDDRDVDTLRRLGHRQPVVDRQERLPHDLQDLVIGAPAAPAPPPRLVLARISVLVLALGLGIGWTLAPRGGPPVTVSVPGAAGVSLQCGPRSCEVSAEFAEGRASGTVDVVAAEHYSCSRTDGTLVCTASSR
ncbi:MAG: hypothetical protein KC912_22060 [Proteobacteria bacterium]|nr:hypothetical protein [Pseudomonadota bacterium]